MNKAKDKQLKGQYRQHSPSKSKNASRFKPFERGDSSAAPPNSFSTFKVGVTKFKSTQDAEKLSESAEEAFEEEGKDQQLA